jgi:N-acetylglucosamine-6-sulfatase
MRSTRTILRLPAAALALTTAVAVVGAVFLSQGASAQAAPGDKPNIVMIVTDDQRLDSLDRQMMPETKRLIADKGTMFSDTVVPTPTCCPSRATMLTGQYGHNNGVVANAPGYRALEDPGNTLPVWLSRAGYQTAHLGKYLNGYEATVESRTEVAPGWDQWYTLLTPRRYYGYNLAVNGREEAFGNQERDHLTRVINRETSRTIRRFSRKVDPFYVQVDHLAPHTENGRSSGPSRCSGRSVPDPRDNELLDTEIKQIELPRPPNFNERDVTDKPSFIRARLGLGKTGKEKLKRRFHCRIASLRAVDRGVKKIVKTLRQEDALDETVIIFTSDNGYFQGEHRISFNKTVPYEEALRVPLAIRVPPGVAEGGEGKVNDLVSNLDLTPTILDLAGGEPCNDAGCRVMDGRSMVPLLEGRGGGFPRDRSVVLEYGRERDKAGLLCEYTGIRDPTRIYIEYTGLASLDGECDSIEEGELYDLTGDPFQLENLFRPNGSAGNGQGTPKAKLEELRDCAGIAGRDPQPPAGASYCE